MSARDQIIFTAMGGFLATATHWIGILEGLAL